MKEMSRDATDVYIVIVKRIPGDAIRVLKWDRDDILVYVDDAGNGNSESVTMYCWKESDGARRLTIYRGGSRPAGVSITIYLPKRFEK